MILGEDFLMLATDMDEVHQGKGFVDVLVQELLLVFTVQVLQVLGLSHLVIQDPLCLLGLKTQEQEVASILLVADLLHLSVQEVPQDVIQGDGIPLQEEVANHAQCPVLQEDPPTLLGLHLKLQIFLLPSYPVHLQVLRILN